MYPIPKLYKLFSPLVNLSNLTLHQKHGHIFSFVKTMFLCNSFGVTQFTWNSRIKYDFRGDNFWGVLTILLKMFKSTYIVKCFVWLQSVYHNLPLPLYIYFFIHDVFPCKKDNFLVYVCTIKFSRVQRCTSFSW